MSCRYESGNAYKVKYEPMGESIDDRVTSLVSLVPPRYQIGSPPIFSRSNPDDFALYPTDYMFVGGVPGESINRCQGSLYMNKKKMANCNEKAVYDPNHCVYHANGFLTCFNPYRTGDPLKH